MGRVRLTLRDATPLASRIAGRTFKGQDTHIDRINGACPQEELDPTMASKKTKKTKKGKR